MKIKISTLATSLFCLTLLGLAIGCSKPNSFGQPERVLTISPQDKACTTDDECTSAMTRCSCDCGEGVNKKHWKKYLDMKDDACRNYDGIMCGMRCDGETKCIKGSCIYKK